MSFQNTKQLMIRTTKSHQKHTHTHNNDATISSTQNQHCQCNHAGRRNCNKHPVVDLASALRLSHGCRCRFVSRTGVSGAKLGAAPKLSPGAGWPGQGWQMSYCPPGGVTSTEPLVFCSVRCARCMSRKLHKSTADLALQMPTWPPGHQSLWGRRARQEC